MHASCQCGQLRVDLPGPSEAVVACHCGFCQRRSGSPFGVLAYYPEAALQITGQATAYARSTDSGGVFETFFCPTCGSTVYARAAKHPSLLGVAIGAIDDLDYPAPVRSVWEENRRPWVRLPEPMQHYGRGRP